MTQKSNFDLTLIYVLKYCWILIFIDKDDHWNRHRRQHEYDDTTFHAKEKVRVATSFFFHSAVTTASTEIRCRLGVRTRISHVLYKQSICFIFYKCYELKRKTSPLVNNSQPPIVLSTSIRFPEILFCWSISKYD